MSWQKTHDLAVRTGTYQGADGKEKGRYENVGHVLHDGEQRLLLLKRTFSPAGVPNPDGRDTVILSMFEVRDRANGEGPTAQQQADVERAAPASAPAARAPAAAAAGDFDDDIPF